jgi:hypothetical protein
MSPNHESVNEALAIAREGMNDAERGIEAIRFARIAELLLDKATAHSEIRAELRASRLGQYMTRQLKSSDTLYKGTLTEV